MHIVRSVNTSLSGRHAFTVLWSSFSLSLMRFSGHSSEMKFEALASAYGFPPGIGGSMALRSGWASGRRNFCGAPAARANAETSQREYW